SSVLSSDTHGDQPRVSVEARAERDKVVERPIAGDPERRTPFSPILGESAKRILISEARQNGFRLAQDDLFRAPPKIACDVKARAQSRGIDPNRFGTAAWKTALICRKIRGRRSTTGRT